MKVKVKIISQYPVYETAQVTLYTTPWQTYSIKHHLGSSGKHSAMLQLIRLLKYTYPPLPIARYSVIKPSELEQCRVDKLAQSLT